MVSRVFVDTSALLALIDRADPQHPAVRGAFARLSDAERVTHGYVVAESLANVAKHSAATRCEIGLRREPERLIVEVLDDGAGGATLVPGGGLAGLRDRVEALDGSLAVASPPGGPTVVHVELPVRPG